MTIWCHRCKFAKGQTPKTEGTNIKKKKSENKTNSAEIVNNHVKQQNFVEMM